MLQHIQVYIFLVVCRLKTEFEENYQNKLDNHHLPSSGEGTVKSGFLTCISSATITDRNGLFFFLRSLSQIRLFFRTEE